jgi:Zn-dependent M28 family amino/carboxypeptidase
MRRLLGMMLAVQMGTAAAAAAKPQGPPPVTAAETLAVLSTVKTLADPKWEGRGVGTAGLDSAAAYLAARFAAIGLKPGGDDGTYLQKFEVTTGVAVGEPCAIEAGGRRVTVGDEFQPLGFSTNGVVRAPVVFAGYGITAPGLDYDDYAGLDARDKLVLVLTNEPGEMDSTSRFDGSVNTPYADLRTKAINAREHGALGLLVVNGPIFHAGEPLRRPRADGAGYMTSGLAAALISDSLGNALVHSSGMTLEQAQRAIEAHGTPHSLPLADTASVTVTLKRTRASIANVVGSIPGRDTSRVLVVGAHYDHLGYGGESSLAPDLHVPHVGADDNASGVAALVATATRFAKLASRGPAPRHELVFIAFTGEESGVLGSGHFVEDPPFPLPTLEAMLNMDMVGRLRDNKLMVMGTGTAAEFPALVANVNASDRFEIKTSSDGFGPSDHSSFYKKKVPVLMLFTGSHADYHKPSDTWDKINYTGLARVARFATRLVDSLDARPRVTYEQAKSDSTVGRIAGGGGYGAYLGTIPDYMQTEGGVLLSGVRAGGPADQGGMKGGDVIVKFDGVRVDNIYDYTFALRSRKPGQQVRITVKRGGAETDLLVTLGRRP